LFSAGAATGFVAANSVRGLAGSGAAAFSAGAGAVSSVASTALAAFTARPGQASGQKRKVKFQYCRIFGIKEKFFFLIITI